MSQQKRYSSTDRKWASSSEWYRFVQDTVSRTYRFKEPRKFLRLGRKFRPICCCTVGPLYYQLYRGEGDLARFISRPNWTTHGTFTGDVVWSASQFLGKVLSSFVLLSLISLYPGSTRNNRYDNVQAPHGRANMLVWATMYIPESLFISDGHWRKNKNAECFACIFLA